MHSRLKQCVIKSPKTLRDSKKFQNELVMYNITNLLTVPVINIPLTRVDVIELKHPENCYFGILFFY